jgi:hypothetical protein
VHNVLADYEGFDKSSSVEYWKLIGGKGVSHVTYGNSSWERRRRHERGEVQSSWLGQLNILVGKDKVTLVVQCVFSTVLSDR